MYALLLRIPRGSIRVQFPRGKVFVQDVEIRVPLKNPRINRWQHVSVSQYSRAMRGSMQRIVVENWTDA
jgi:hypothetical protein